MKPNAIIAGMMKSGTTSLYRWLCRHPQMVSCDAKEPHYFSERWSRGERWYASLFPASPKEALTFEASQSYSHPDLANEVAARIRKTLPEVRLIFVLRHPVARARSEYRHQVQRSREHRRFLEAVRDPASPYLRRSMYYTCLKPFLGAFPREQLIFLRFEDLFSSDHTEWRRLLLQLRIEVIDRPSVAVESTLRGPRRRKMTMILAGLGGARVATRVPRRLRRLVRPLFVQDDSDYRDLIDSSWELLPPETEALVWEDVARMEEWLGRELAWSEQQQPL
ncbi:MAG: sulfotransferase [Thermoanaerobaculia bacterium]